MAIPEEDDGSLLGGMAKGAAMGGVTAGMAMHPWARRGLRSAAKWMGRPTTRTLAGKAGTVEVPASPGGQRMANQAADTLDTAAGEVNQMGQRARDAIAQRQRTARAREAYKTGGEAQAAQQQAIDAQTEALVNLARRGGREDKQALYESLLKLGETNPAFYKAIGSPKNPTKELSRLAGIGKNGLKPETQERVLRRVMDQLKQAGTSESRALTAAGPLNQQRSLRQAMPTAGGLLGAGAGAGAVAGVANEQPDPFD